MAGYLCDNSRLTSLAITHTSPAINYAYAALGTNCSFFNEGTTPKEPEINHNSVPDCRWEMKRWLIRLERYIGCTRGYGRSVNTAADGKVGSSQIGFMFVHSDQLCCLEVSS